MSRTFTPLPWQVKPWCDTSPVCVISSGAGTGKSWLYLWKISAYCMRYPGALALVVRKYGNSLRNSVIPWLEQIVPPGTVHEVSNSRFVFPRSKCGKQSRIVYGGMKDANQREKIRSIVGTTSGVDIALMEEASSFVWEDKEEIEGRMRGKAAPWQQIGIITNPGPTSHWINQKLILPAQGGQLKGVSVYRPTCEQNPTLGAAYMERLNGLTGVRLKRMRHGLWCNAEGTVYEDSWDADKHIVEPFAIPPEWPRYRSIDLGFVNPRVCLWIAEDPDGVGYVYRQIYRTKQRGIEFAKDINRFSNREKFESSICDHDSNQRADLAAEGIQTIPARKDVSMGIQAVEARLLGAGNGPRLFFFRGSLVGVDEELKESFKPTCTEEEFEVYEWSRDKNGNICKEEPKKENDHGMDAIRYYVMHRDRHLWQPSAGTPTLGKLTETYSEKRKSAGLSVF